MAMHAGARAATFSRIAAKTICWIAPNRAGDISSAEVSEEVLCLGGQSEDPQPGGAVTCANVGGVDPATLGVECILVTICRAWVLLEVSIAFCLFAVLLGFFIGTHVLNSKVPTDGTNWYV
ncbi:UNVERIFIED_CONTAM: hypothetical protein Sradi_0711300 [Sesamum radiatum]|uniref:Uncharacterized protein n=1 Tax=Sesamum radiatum TaxID=300843 RepID=A0AAW2VNG1_SESRA